MSGHLISIEGPDGAGKSTLSRILTEELTKDGHDVVLTKQPGGSPRCLEIRQLLLNRTADEGFCDLTQIALFYADRFQHLYDVVLPALQAGKVVISDRSELSTYAYQIHAPEKYELVEYFLGQHALVRQMLNEYPCRTLVCELSIEEADRRLKKRAADHGETNFFDTLPVTFKQRVHEGMREGRQHLMPAYEFADVNVEREPHDIVAEMRYVTGL